MGVVHNKAAIDELKARLDSLAAELATIDEELADYLPLSGGTVTGDLTVTGGTSTGTLTVTGATGTGDVAVTGDLSVSGAATLANASVEGWKNTGTTYKPVFINNSGVPNVCNPLTGGLSSDLDTSTTPEVIRYSATSNNSFNSKSGALFTFSVSATKIIQFALSVDGDALGVRIGTLAGDPATWTFSAWKSAALS